MRTTGGGLHVRRALVVFQFGISVVLIVSTLVILRQLRYVENYELGYNRDHVVVVENGFMLRQQSETFKQAIERVPSVQQTAYSDALPTGGDYDGSAYFGPGKTPENSIVVVDWSVDADLASVLDFEFVHGRWFDSDRATDTLAVVLNEQAARDFELGDNPIGKIVNGSPDGRNTKLEVIGVVKDFHFQSVRQSIDPVVFRLSRTSRCMLAKVRSDDLKGSIAAIENEWKALLPDAPFSYTFLDDEFAAIYAQEARLADLVTILAGLAVFIACLGLFGLSAFTAEQRTKEIGVRRVLGASTVQVVNLLAKDFLRLVAVALVIGLPAGYFLMREWLVDFSVRTPIGWDVFAIAAVAALLIAYLTLSYQSVRTARRNPAYTLRTE